MHSACDDENVTQLAKPAAVDGYYVESMEQARENSKRWVISTQEEMRQAAIEVVSEASRKVSIFTHDLEPGIYDNPEFLEIIKRMVLSQTYARIRVLIADPSRAV